MQRAHLHNIKLLIKAGARLDCKNHAGLTLLELAHLSDDETIIRALIIASTSTLYYAFGKPLTIFKFSTKSGKEKQPTSYTETNAAACSRYSLLALYPTDEEDDKSGNTEAGSADFIVDKKPL